MILKCSVNLCIDSHGFIRDFFARLLTEIEITQCSEYTVCAINPEKEELRTFSEDYKRKSHYKSIFSLVLEPSEKLKFIQS